MHVPSIIIKISMELTNFSGTCSICLRGMVTEKPDCCVHTDVWMRFSVRRENLSSPIVMHFGILGTIYCGLERTFLFAYKGLTRVFAYGQIDFGPVRQQLLLSILYLSN